MYVRKSSESEERQIQSTDDQKRYLTQKSEELHLNVVKIFVEEHSAKKPNTRPIFAEMIKYIEDGKADGVLCWQINRLARNPVDSATVQWLLQQGALKSVMTYEKEFLSNDNAILFSVESGMANQFIIELRANTRRGIDSKIEKGWFPGLAPLGYLNDKQNEKGQKQILIDEERWCYVRRIWDLMLTGNYNPRQVLETVTREGLTTRQTKRQGGGPVTSSGIYRILTNVFYAGAFEQCGKTHIGKHKAMVTQDEFDRVQTILGSRGRPRPQKREFAYTGIVRCGECGCLVTAETKTKYVKSTAQIASYTYYRCTKKRREAHCTQKPININDFESQVLYELSGFAIAPEFKEWAIHILQQENEQEFKLRAQKHKQLTRLMQNSEKELYDLNKTYTRGRLDEDFYVAEKDKLKIKIAQSKTELASSQDATNKWVTLSENVFKLACHAAETYAKADVRTKREIFAALGGQFVLTDGKLSYEPEKWFVRIADAYPELRQKLELVRTRKINNLYLEFMQIATILKIWGERRGSNPRHSGPQPDALPTELHPPNSFTTVAFFLKIIHP